MHYWQSGSLPDDDRKLARIARMSADEWSDARATISEFFSEGWTHKRIDEELAKAEEISSKRKASASRRWSNRNANAYASALQKQCTRDVVVTVDSDTSDLSGKGEIPPKPRARGPVEILSEVVSEKTAADVVAHRKALRKPLTPRAAELLAKTLAASGDAEHAAATMIERGWQGYRADWDGAKPNARAGPNSRG